MKKKNTIILLVITAVLFLAIILIINITIENTDKGSLEDPTTVEITQDQITKSIPVDDKLKTPELKDTAPIEELPLPTSVPLTN